MKKYTKNPKQTRLPAEKKRPFLSISARTGVFYLSQEAGILLKLEEDSKIILFNEGDAWFIAGGKNEGFRLHERKDKKNQTISFSSAILARKIVGNSISTHRFLISNDRVHDGYTLFKLTRNYEKS